MSPASKSSMVRLRGGAAMLLICLSLPIADRFSEGVGAEMAAFWVFLFLFVAWFAVVLLMDSWGRPREGEVAGRGIAGKGD